MVQMTDRITAHLCLLSPHLRRTQSLRALSRIAQTQVRILQESACDLPIIGATTRLSSESSGSSFDEVALIRELRPLCKRYPGSYRSAVNIRP
jgi:hypothetical protein